MSKRVPDYRDASGWSRHDSIEIGGVPTERWIRDVFDGFLTLLVSRPSWGWKASISHQRRVVKPGGSHFGRFPTWEEIIDARYRFLPHDKWFGMYLPPPGDYINVTPDSTVFHLDELPNPDREAPR